LGAIILNNQIIYEISDLIDYDYFLVPIHQKIFFSLKRLIFSDMLATPLILKQELKNETIFKEINCYEYLINLTITAQFIGDLVGLANIVKGYYIKRKLAEISRNALDKIHKGNHQNAQEIINEMQNKILTIENINSSNKDFFLLADLINNVVKNVAIMKQSQKKLTGVDTGFIDMNEKTGGLQKSDLIILAARPSMGKTSLCINLARNAAHSFVKENTDQKVVFFSLEMSAEQIANRMLAIETGIDSNRIRNAKISDREFQMLTNGKEKRFIESLPIIIDDSAALSIANLRNKVLSLSRQNKIGIVIVDYLQLVRPSVHHSSRVQEIGEISQGLKALAKEINIPVVALSQLSRAVESREDKRPLLSDLRDSGNIEQDADIVIFLYREAYYLERKKNADEEKLNEIKNIAEVIIAKQRNGPIGTVILHFNSATTAFSNLEHNEYAFYN
jgi:replicative DNA helicase